MSRPGLWLIFQFLLSWRLGSPMNSLTGTSNPSRLFCARYGRFEQPKKGYALANHVIATYISIACPLDCSIECVADIRCQSFNCVESGNKCELNDQRRETRPSDFGTRGNATYFGPTPQQEGTGSGCMSVTCQHGGTCVDSCWNPQMFTCECRKDYEGVFCEKHSGVKTCQELKTLGENLDGVYDINPDGRGIIEVLCDQTTDGGGWTVVQRRFSPYSGNFERVWLEYKNGFGDLSGEFWLGNDNLHRLAASSSVLRIDLTANTGQTGYAKYGGFTVGDETTKFRWDMNSYQGNIGNRVYGHSHAPWNTRGMKFSAKDADNDNSPDAHCGADVGWWFNWCGLVNLNQQAEPHWNGWATITLSEMKVRKN